MKRKTFEKGKLYKIRFYDHSIGSKEKMICEAVGWVEEDDKDHVVLTHWRVDTKDLQVARDNIEPTSIIKSAILSSRKYA